MKYSELYKFIITNSILYTFVRIKGSYRVKVRGKSFAIRCTGLHDFDFARKMSRGMWHADMLAIFDHYLHSDSVYLDIGAWIGLTPLYAAEICKEVYCLEPDPVAYKKLVDNIDHNKSHIHSFKLALCKRDTKVQLFYTTLGNSTSSLLGNNDKFLLVDGICFESLMGMINLSRVNFIKMDIEGGEYTILEDMRNFLNENKPHLHLSLHPHNLDLSEIRYKTSSLIDVLSMYKYYYRGNMTPIKLSELIDNPVSSSPRTLFLTNSEYLPPIH